MNRADRAIELFNNNFNCSQAVFTVFAADYGISEELALKAGYFLWRRCKERRNVRCGFGCAYGSGLGIRSF